MEDTTQLHYKQKYLEDNEDVSEVRPQGDKSISVGNFQRIDELNDEIWLLQCPKGTDLTQLIGQKLKLPGRTNTGQLEAVAMEHIAAVVAAEQQAPQIKHPFGYCNRKGKYALRLLPVRGNIIVRQQLKANESVSEERIANICAMPAPMKLPAVRVRHPLLGAGYERKLQLPKKLMERLRKADDESNKVTREAREAAAAARLQKSRAKRQQAKISLGSLQGHSFVIEVDDDEDGDNLNNSKKSKGKSRKRMTSIKQNGESESVESSPKKKTKKSNRNGVYTIGEDDMQFLTKLK